MTVPLEKKSRFVTDSYSGGLGGGWNSACTSALEKKINTNYIISWIESIISNGKCFLQMTTSVSQSTAFLAVLISFLLLEFHYRMVDDRSLLLLINFLLSMQSWWLKYPTIKKQTKHYKYFFSTSSNQCVQHFTLCPNLWRCDCFLSGSSYCSQALYIKRLQKCYQKFYAYKRWIKITTNTSLYPLLQPNFRVTSVHQSYSLVSYSH